MIIFKFMFVKQDFEINKISKLISFFYYDTTKWTILNKNNNIILDTKNVKYFSSVSYVIFYLINLYEKMGIHCVEQKYESFRDIIFLYNADHEIILANDLQNEKENNNSPKYPCIKNISDAFYEGFMMPNIVVSDGHSKHY